MCVYVLLDTDPNTRTLASDGSRNLVHLAATTDGTDIEFRSLLTKIKSLTEG